MKSDPANTSTSFTLPGGRTLTAAQHYHWGVQAISDTGKFTTETGEFQTIAPPSTSPFSSVTVLTHGFTLLPTSTGVPDTFFDLADKIVSVNSNLPENKGLILLYNKPTGLWVPVDENAQVLTDVTGGLNPGDANYLSTLARNIQSNYVNQNKPLVLLPEWSTQGESIMPDSGLTEAAADTFFASLVQLDQALGGDVGEHDSAGNLVRLYKDNGDLIRTQGALFNSPLHFIGYSRGAVVNSEIIQRLGTYFPYSGGALNPDGSPVVNAQGQRVRDLQMTTIDPHDFYQESLKVDGIIPGTTIFRDFRDFNEPTVQVWDNVTFADNYYQTLADPNGRTWTPNGRAIENADLNVRLDGRTGFTEDNPLNPLDSPHIKIFTWYAGTLDLGLDEALSGYEPEPVANRVYDLPGEAAVTQLFDLAAPTLTPWYSSGGNIGSTEGIGTGWFYSKLGGGNRTGVDLSRRVTVDFDNTDEDIVPGDFAVPTVFNGNFDVGLSDDQNAPVPGWSFHNGDEPLLRKYLVEKKSIPTLVVPLSGVKEEDLVLQMGGGDGGLREFTHNWEKVPDWGVLRFDVHVPVPSPLDDMDDYIQVELETDGKIYNLQSQQINPITLIPGDLINQELPAVDLREVHPGAFSNPELGLAVPFERIQSQLNRVGFGSKGFETFQVDVPDEVRGKIAKIKISLHGNRTVYIDNIFFQSKHLQFGNPALNGQEARKDENFSQIDNYLIEKSQFTLSYNESLKTPNWVSYQLNSSWNQGPNGNISRKEVGDPFASDYSLASPPFTKIPGNPKNYDVFQRGHMTRAEDRSRLLESYYPDSQTNERYKIYKDYKLTYLMSNMIPQNIIEKGVDPWGELEKFISEALVTGKGKELYIVAGRDGERKTFTTPIDDVNVSISAPSHVWKVFLVLNPGQGIADITKDTLAFAVDIPNFSQGDVDRGTPGAPSTISKDWKKYVVSINDLEAVTGYDFFNNIPTNIQEIIESNTDINKLSKIPGASLKAAYDVEGDSVFKEFKTGSLIDTSIWQSQIPNESIMGSEDRLSISGSSQVSLNQNSSFQIGEEQIGILQARFGQVSTTQISHTQVNTRPISSIQTGAVQASVAQIDINQGTADHRSSIQSSVAQVTSVNVDTIQVSTAQVNPSQINIF